MKVKSHKQKLCYQPNLLFIANLLHCYLLLFQTLAVGIEFIARVKLTNSRTENSSKRDQDFRAQGL